MQSASNNANSHPCLLLHGLISTPNEFSVVRNTLEQKGASIHAPMLPGYSFEEGQKPTSWRDWLEAARRELYEQTDKHGPVVLGGLCIGAVTALALAAEERERVAGLVLLSPTLYYDGWGLSKLRRLRHLGYYIPGLKRRITVPEVEPFGVKNPQIRKFIAREMKQKAHSSAGAAHLPLWAIHEAERLMAHVRRQLHRIHAPTLILHAREDEVASLKSPNFLMNSLAARDRRMVVLENSYHMITLDNDRHTVVEEMSKFLRRPVGTRPMHDVSVASSPILAPQPILAGDPTCQPL